MPVDVDDTTKLLVEQRKFLISTGSLSRRRRKPQQLSIYPTNCANVSSATIASGKHTLSNRWAKILDEKFVENSKEDLFSTVLFLLQVLYLFDRNVHRDGAIFAVHAQHMIVMQRRTGAPHSVTRPRGAERAPDPWVEVHRESARARYRCLQRVASRQSGVTSSPLLASKLDVNSRPEGSFFFICVFVFVACAIKKRVSQKKKKKKKSPRRGGARATRATCELRACVVPYVFVGMSRCVCVRMHGYVCMYVCLTCKWR